MVLSDVNVNHLHQPWRSFAAIINKCLSGKTTALENLVYQVENKNYKNNNDMYYPRFTKVIVDYFMAKDYAIPRRNKMFWHYARDDLMFTIRRYSPSALNKPNHVGVRSLQDTNQAILRFTLEQKARHNNTKIKTNDELSFNESGFKCNEGTGVTPGVPDVPSYDSEAEQISWKSNDEEDDDEVNIGDDNETMLKNKMMMDRIWDEQDDDIQDDDDQEHDEQDDEEQDDVNEQTDSNNDGDEFVHPKLSTHDEEDKDEEDSDPRVHTPSTNDEESDEKNTRDVNVNLEGRDTEMTNVPCIIVQTTQELYSSHISCWTESEYMSAYSFVLVTLGNSYWSLGSCWFHHVPFIMFLLMVVFSVTTGLTMVPPGAYTVPTGCIF
ncbi:hypothetical protein Tco_0827712 [Tanacetum coccineum]